MSKVMHMLLWGAASISVVSAATVEDVSERLAEALQSEAEVLASVRDASSAASAVQPLQKVLDTLKGLNGQVSEVDLWNYIDSTQGVKARMVDQLEEIARELARLEDAQFFGCSELGDLLAPLVTADVAKPDAQ